MSDFRRLQEFIIIISEACRAFADVSVKHLQAMASQEYSTFLIVEIRTRYRSAVNELHQNLSSLPDKPARLSYISEAILLIRKHESLHGFVLGSGKAMFDTLIGSGDPRTVEEQAYSRLHSIVNPCLEHDLAAGLATNTLSNNNRGHIALLQVVGSGAYHYWKQLNEEFDSQMRIYKASASALNFEEADFLLTVGLEESTLKLIDPILIEDMKAIRKTPEGKFHLVDSKGSGRPLVAFFKMLIALGEVNESEHGHQIAWKRFLENSGVVQQKRTVS